MVTPARSGRVRWVEVDRLGAHVRAWDDLVLEQPVPSPFLRSWWLQAQPQAGTSYLLVLDGDQLLGGLALKQDRLLGVRRYRLVGQGVLCPDHMDLVAAPGREHQVMACFAQWFAARGQRLLDFDGLVVRPLAAVALGRVTQLVDVAPYDVVSVVGVDYLETRSPSFRRSVRRSQKRLTRAGFAHRSVSAGSLDAALDAFTTLTEHRSGREALLAELPVLRRAVSQGVQRGEARVDLLVSDRAVVAASIAFCVAGRLSLYQVARSLDRHHDGAGTVLLHRVISDAVARGGTEVDLLRGGEAYKSSFADDLREVHRLRAGNRGWARAVGTSWHLMSVVRRRARSLGRPA